MRTIQDQFHAMQSSSQITPAKLAKTQDCGFCKQLDDAIGEGDGAGGKLIGSANGLESAIDEPDNLTDEDRVHEESDSADQVITKRTDKASTVTMFGAETSVAVSAAIAGSGAASFQALIHWKNGVNAGTLPTTAEAFERLLISNAHCAIGTPSGDSAKYTSIPGRPVRDTETVASGKALQKAQAPEITDKFETVKPELMVLFWNAPQAEVTTGQSRHSAAGWNITEQFTNAVLHLMNNTPAGTVKTLRLRLHPAELGQLLIKLQQQGDDVTITLLAKTDAGHAKIVAEKDAILRGLDLQGVSVANVYIQPPSEEAASTLPLDSGERAAIAFTSGENGAGGRSTREDTPVAFSSRESSSDIGLDPDNSELYI